MSNKIFTTTPVKGIPSNSFDLTHDVKMSCNDGLIIPIVCEEVLPADRISYNNVTMVRLAPMVAPVMHKMDVTTVSFFVPLRLLWEQSYEKFFQNPIPDETTPVAPYLSNLVVNTGELGDYLGLPTRDVISDDGTIRQQYNTLDKVSAFPFAVYQKACNDFFRDQNLVNNGEEFEYKLTDGSNNAQGAQLYQLRRRAWQHDYFTSALPFAQKGDPVEIPLANFEDVPVYKNNHTVPGQNNWNSIDQPGSIPSGTSVPNRVDVDRPDGFLWADTSMLSNQAAVTVNALRWATKLQEFLEKNARGGTRYIELVRQHFGVRSSDARLQRAEFLGWSSQPVVISEVLQTSPSTEGDTPLAEMAGHGISVGSTRNVNYFAEEHGFFLTVLIIRPKTAYQQGIPRMWSRWTALDYAYPTFAHLGEQEILNREVYYSDTEGSPTLNNEVFGYIPRYAEYRYANSRVAGDFRTNLAHWHMGRVFQDRPALNENFIDCVPTARIFAVNTPSVHHYYLHVNNKLRMRRALPMFGVPAL